MPYFTAAMVRYMKRKDGKGAEQQKSMKKKSGAKTPQNKLGGKTPRQGKRLRITPSCVDVDPDEGVKRVKQKDLNFDERKLLYMKTLLNKQVAKIHSLEGPMPISASKDFSDYVFTENEIDTIYQDERCALYKMINKRFADLPMVVKIYTADQASLIKNPIYFKVLRHLGKKHPCIIQTWDIFRDNNNRVLVMQEFANRNTMATHVSVNGPVDEMLACSWAKQLSQALDYMGDMGLCHRQINPNNVLLAHSQLSIRLTGFYDTIIYWNAQTEEAIYLPCKPLSNKSRDLPDFQAPEIYSSSDNEVYEPVAADIWSFGAVIYYAATCSYPYDFRQDSPDIEKDIQDNIQKLTLSAEANELFVSLLTSNAMQRATFDRIINTSWFSKLKKN